MYAVKRLETIDALIPTLQELHAIRFIVVNGPAVLPAAIGYRPLFYQNPIWKQLVDSWYTLIYFKRSATVRLDAKMSAVIGKMEFVMKSGIDNKLFEEAYPLLATLWGPQFTYPVELFTKVHNLLETSDKVPSNLSILSLHADWTFKGFHYFASQSFTDEQFRLLILEDYRQMQNQANAELEFWDELKRRHTDSDSEDLEPKRISIPVNVRREVWRRDGGRCARCGSRENLEFDHIVPVSKGGSSTARNIELLCENCNRKKAANIG